MKIQTLFVLKASFETSPKKKGWGLRKNGSVVHFLLKTGETNSKVSRNSKESSMSRSKKYKLHILRTWEKSQPPPSRNEKTLDADAEQRLVVQLRSGRNPKSPLCGACKDGKTPSFMFGTCCSCKQHKVGIVAAVFISGLVFVFVGV